MTKLTKEQDQYIEHEVQIRLHDEKFKLIERDFDEVKSSIHHLDNKLEYSIKHLDNKLSWGIGVFIAISLIGWMMPIALQFIKIKA